MSPLPKYHPFISDFSSAHVPLGIHDFVCLSVSLYTALCRVSG